jgi:DNA-binding beta-propeller fold protein YncE
MIALLYLLVAVCLGDAICRRFFAYASTPHRLATAFLSGILISTWWTYLAALVFAQASSPMLWGNLVFFVTAIGTTIVLWRLPIDLPTTTIAHESTRFMKWDWIVTGVILAFAVYLMFLTFSMNDGNLRIGHHQSSDFGSTVSIMQTFAQGHNFPTEYPHFTGDRIRYHFLFYFQGGNLEYLGLSPAMSNNLLSILSLMSMLVLVMTLGAVLFASRVVGRIAAGLFFFHGSLAFIPFYLANGSLSAVWAKLDTLRDFLSSGLPYRGEDWGVWSQVVYLNQRHLSSSIGIFLIVLVFLAIRHREKIESAAALAPVETSSWVNEPEIDPENEEVSDETEIEYEGSEANLTDADEPAKLEIADDAEQDEVDNDHGEAEEEAEGEDDSTEYEDDDELDETDDQSPSDANTEPRDPVDWLKDYGPFVLAGALLGLLPMWNGAVFAGTAAVLALMLLLLPFRKEMLALAAASAVVALPQILFLKTGMLREPGYSFFHWGYTIDDPTFYKVFYYLAFTFGFKWVLIAIAVAFGTRLQRLMMLAFTSLIVMATCFQFSEELLANHKFFNVWLVLINVPVAFGLVTLWNLIPGPGVWAGRLAAIILSFLITIGGVIDIFPIRNSYMVEYKYEGDPLVEWVKNNTDPKSIFLSQRYVNHGILLAGRRLFYGHPYYAWTAGYPTFERDGVYKKMFESQNISEVFQLLKDNRISYVAVDNAIRRGDFIKKSNEKLMEAYFQTVFSDTNNRYDNLKIFAVPDVLGPPNPNVELPQASPSPTPTARTAFEGGEGNGPGQFSRPRGIVADAKGNFYVADTGNGRVQKFDFDGKFLDAYGKPGASEGELGEPNGIAVDSTGNIFVADALNYKLVKLAPDGKFVKEWKGPEPGFYGPRDIAFGPNKNLYIVDQGRTRIVRFDPSTEVFTSWGTAGTGEGQFHESTGIAIGDNLVFVADLQNNRIQVFDLDGKFIRMWEVPPWERYVWLYPDMALDEQSKRLYVTNGWKNEILLYDLNGNPLEGTIKPIGELNNASALCFIENGKRRRLLVLNTGGSKVSAIDLEAKLSK